MRQLTGFLAYGVSLALFVVGLLSLGTARTSAYFSVAPFFGALLAVTVLDEPINSLLLISGGLMSFGVWLHLTEKHQHVHRHFPIEHRHPFAPEDLHHQDVQIVEGDRHRHGHCTHSHPHYPDIHHRHEHERRHDEG